MLFQNSIPMAIGLLVSNAMAMPIPSANAPGLKCTTEGKVLCADNKFQTCASGTWSVSMALADGMDCSMFGPVAPAAPVSSAAAPVSSAAAPVSSAAAPVSSVAAPVTTAVVAPPTSAVVVPTTSADVGLGALQTTSSIVAVSTTAVAQTTTTAVAPVSAPPAPTTHSAPAPTTSAPATPSGGGNTTPGKMQAYSGPESSFPTSDKWLTYDALWTLNKGVCDLPGNDGKGSLISTDIQAAATKYGVDPRIVLAVVLQESTCLLSAVTTNGGISNPGLMQSHNGVGYDGTDGSIMQMMEDGTGGTAYKTDGTGGDGLEQVIKKYGTFAGLRVYNSGDLALNKADLSQSTYNGAPIGTASYCSDVANRLTGAKVAT